MKKSNINKWTVIYIFAAENPRFDKKKLWELAWKNNRGIRILIAIFSSAVHKLDYFVS